MKFATLAVSIMIVVAVLMPGGNLPDVHVGGYDKVIHFGMFFVWAIAVRYDFGRESFRFLLFLSIGILFSILTEVLQIIVEGRSFDIYDMIADQLGLIVGLVIGKPLIGWIKVRNN